MSVAEILTPNRPGVPRDGGHEFHIRIAPPGQKVEDSWAERTAGILQWTGDPEVLRRVAEDDEFSILES